jgi:superfamily II DNA helicase RecQ
VLQRCAIALRFAQLHYVLRRPQYGEIARLREVLTNQIVACTATADEPTREQIFTTLQMRNPKIVSMDSRRENMSLFVTRKHPRSCEADLVHALRRSTAAKALVFCRMRDEADRVSKMLIANKISSIAYHSAIPDREGALEQFQSGVQL